MGPNQRVIKRGGENADTDNSANNHHIISSICLALEAAFLQWVEGEKEFYIKIAKVFNNFCDLYGIALISSGKG